MASVPEMALQEAERLGLDLTVKTWMVPVDAFSFECLEPKPGIQAIFHQARNAGMEWVPEMALPVLTYHPRERKFRIMDGMMRICAAQVAHFKEIPALVANGDTYDALQPILDHGYYGEDFIEMLSMVNEDVRENIERRERYRLSGSRGG
jgi:hypothetical protein